VVKVFFTMKRVATAELLDTDSGTPAEIADSLSDLRRFNRWLGGISTTRSMIQHVAGELGVRSLSLLEVAAGSGYVPNNVRQRLEGEGLRLEVTLLDRAASHLNGGSRAVVGDALALPFPESSFDLVSCTLFAHHLEPTQFVQFVNEALCVCRSAVLLNDLIRHPLHLALVYLGLPLYQSRITRHDAPASVRQAYTQQEMRALLAQTAAAKVEIGRHYLFRMGVIAWKRDVGGHLGDTPKC
jgi:ubiquinone/menaquinone biosynthesis C-methylase UbiE